MGRGWVHLQDSKQWSSVCYTFRHLDGDNCAAQGRLCFSWYSWALHLGPSKYDTPGRRAANWACAKSHNSKMYKMPRSKPMAGLLLKPPRSQLPRTAAAALPSSHPGR